MMDRIRTIGQGGLGHVDLYKAQNGTFYAVKQMLYQWDETHFERFKREVEILSSLTHKNIVRILNFDLHNGSPWYVMPYYKEGSLRDNLLNLKSKGQIYSVKGASGLILYLAEALQYSHSRGIIHRDLKPENILFEGKIPVIADWGIGKFIHKQSKVLTGVQLGTKGYCSPEQWNSGVSDHRSDIYSLGLIYRELISGQVYGQVKDQRVNQIINRMTAVSPSDRHNSMDEVIQDIRALDMVSNKPLDDFWKAALITAGIAGLVYILSKTLD